MLLRRNDPRVVEFRTIEDALASQRDRPSVARLYALLFQDGGNRRPRKEVTQNV